MHPSTCPRRSRAGHIGNLPPVRSHPQKLAEKGGGPVRWGVWVYAGTFVLALITMSFVWSGIEYALGLRSTTIYPLAMTAFAGTQAAAVSWVKIKLINPAFRVAVFRPFARRKHDLLGRIVAPTIGRFGAVKILLDSSASPAARDPEVNWTDWTGDVFRDSRSAIRSDDANWREEVQRLIDNCDAAVFYVDGWSRNLFWEWSRVVETLPKSRCLAVIDKKWEQSNPEFAQKLRREAFPDWATASSEEGIRATTALEAAIRRWLRSM